VDLLDAAALKNFVYRHLAHAGRFHRHGLDTERRESIGHALKIARKGLELSALGHHIAPIQLQRHGIATQCRSPPHVHEQSVAPLVFY